MFETGSDLEYSERFRRHCRWLYDCLTISFGDLAFCFVSDTILNTVDTFIKLLDIGCHTGSVFVGCIMYADDIILLCPSLHGLQTDD